MVLTSPAQHTKSSSSVSAGQTCSKPASPLSLALQGTDIALIITVDVVVTGAHAAISKGAGKPTAIF